MSALFRTLLPAFALLVGGCTVHTNLPGRDAPPPAPAPAEAKAPERPLTPSEELNKQAEEAFAKRADPAELEKAITAWRKALAIKDDFDVRVRLARAHHFRAQTARPGDAGRDDRLEQYGFGVEHARAALKLKGIGADAVCSEKATIAEVPALYWLAENLLGHARELGLAASGEQRRQALCVAERAVELDPDYFHGGPARVLAAILSQQPALAGGDLDRSRMLFDRSLLAGPSFLQTRVDLAATWAVKKQQRNDFQQQLNAVLVAPTDVVAEIEPENRIARDRARGLLEKERDLF